MKPYLGLVILLALIGLAVALVMPNFIRARSTRAINTCIDINLRAIEEAKGRWAKDHAQPTGTVPEINLILPYLKNSNMPVCPAGGRYIIGPIGSHPLCSLTNEHPWNPKAE
jgi:hypothetical protein